MKNLVLVFLVVLALGCIGAPQGNTTTTFPTTTAVVENLPDLVISDVTLTPPASTSPLVRFKINNIGKASTEWGVASVRILKSENNTNTTILGPSNSSYGAISPDTYTLLEFISNMFLPTDAKYFVEIIADAGGNAKESDETNNVFSKAFTVPLE